MTTEKKSERKLESYVVEMDNILKTFPGIIANDHVSFNLKKGEIHALLGENGAGKSTLMSILFGLYQADSGSIKVNGELVKIDSPNIANELGIGMVHQHFKLVDTFTVTENIVLGMEDTKNGFLTYEESIEKIRDLSKKYGLNVDPSSLIRDISVGQQQRVEILKMLYREAEIMVFDEPTAVLTPQEIEELIKIMKLLVKEGKSIILITHKLEEIKLVADRVTVLQKGKYIDTVPVASTTVERMAEMMVGRKVIFTVERGSARPTDVVLEVENLSVYNNVLKKNDVTDVSFKLRKGEILCIAGIEGNGQTQLVEAITGLRPISDGDIFLNGESIALDTIRNRNLKGISHIPEDRHKFGLVLDFTVKENIVLQSYFQDEMRNGQFIDEDAVEKYAERIQEEYDVRSGKGVYSIARSMSGGNQQKAIVGREIERQTDVLIAVQPTRGLDVGAIEFIHKQLIKHRDNGKAVLLVSLELDEVFNVSDRIIVMYEGENVGEFKTNEIDENTLGLYMSGSKRSNK
jgi:ABC-type uncharacterized transport system ATPase subunit